MDDYAASRIGEQFGNYHLLRLLGQGGFADVYLGEHLYLKTHAALKVLRIQLTDHALQDFLTEARTIARLEHPQIVRVLECGVEHRTPFLVMNYAPNGTLRQRYPKGFRLPLEVVVAYVQQIASALDYAHQAKLIHRDIKPENMLLGRANEVLLSDFGLVLIAQSTGSQTMKEMAGTVPYMAPEQLQGKPRPVSDQYSLGIVVYEWLSGERPFQGSFAEIASQHLLASPPSLCERVQGVSPAVESVVFTALAKNPQQRFASVGEFAIAFEHACKSTQQFSEPLHQVTSPFAFSQQATVINTPLVSASSTTYMRPPQSVSEQSTIINTPSTQATFVRTPSNLPQQSDSMLTRVDAHRKARPRLRLAIALLLCALLLISTSVGYAILRSGLHQGGPVATSSTTVTITPKSIDLKKSYTISAVTGTPDTSKHQVAARSLSSTTQAYTKTVNATGSGTTPATKAKGTLTFLITSGNLVVPAGVTWTGYDGTQVMNDQALCLNGPAPGNNATATVSAHSILAGSSYNIAAQDIHTDVISYLQTSPCSNTQGISGSKQLADKVEQCGCSSNRTPGTVIHSPAVPFSGGLWIVYNSSAFTGGQNLQTYTFVRQSDIDGAASSLETANMPNAQQVLQQQIHANERLIGSPHCLPNVTTDHAVDDVANTVTVSVTFTCIGEVYDQQGALVAAEQWLKQDAAQNPGAGYVLVGNVVTKQTDAQMPDPTQGTIAIAVSAEGVWVYQFNDAQQRTLAKLVAGKTRGIAQSLLSEQQGIASIDIQLPVADHDTLPTDPSLIKLIVLNVQGKSS